jgi:hypothetical protein
MKFLMTRLMTPQREVVFAIFSRPPQETNSVIITIRYRISSLCNSIIATAHYRFVLGREAYCFY